IETTNVDAVLVGDSSAMVMHGFENTINANIEMMAWHTSAVAKGIKTKLIISDLPFLAHLKGRKKLVESVDFLFKSGAQALKIEGAGDTLNDIEFLVKSGIPIMGHLGMTPQSVHKFGGFKVQGKLSKDAERIIKEAEELQNAGCFSIVLEMVPTELARQITEKLDIPTIGIGAGHYTSGQVLVLQDLLGMNSNFNPKFLKKYLDGRKLITDALNKYDAEVKSNSFPSSDESYS
ncbi:MAG: 3-methyl-2-oxobutanoate hydroxymethyltransferase, partial [Melioribacteraceae bacterium]|nr:3-methyl-2-oxobutanoate hydroxymethyltransferase [Melioribacteraceae bacterium]